MESQVVDLNQPEPPTKKMKMNSKQYRFGMLRFSKLYRDNPSRFSLAQYSELIDLIRYPNKNEEDKRFEERKLNPDAYVQEDEDEDFPDDLPAYYYYPPQTAYWSELRSVLAEQLKENENERLDIKRAVATGEINHGDVFCFGEYRAMGTYIACREIRQVAPNQEQVDFRLLQTHGEYGYYIPLEFSDAPYEFFRDNAYSQLVYVLTDPEHTFPGSDLESILHNPPEPTFPQDKEDNPYDFMEEIQERMRPDGVYRVKAWSRDFDQWEDFDLGEYRYNKWLDAVKEERKRMVPLLSMLLKPLELPEGVICTIVNFII